MKSNLVVIAILWLKLWFPVFDTTRFQFFVQVFAHFKRFLILSPYHVFDSPYITLLALKIKHNG